MNLSAHFANIQIERDLTYDRLLAAESSGNSTFEEVRILRRQLEQLEHQLMWRSLAPKGWVE